MSQGYEPHFDYDLGYGLAGEDTAQAWHRGKHETKRKSYLDANFYVELEHLPRGATSYCPSGLSVTEADYFEFVIHDTGVIVAFPADLLRRAIDLGKGRPAAETDGDNPTRGRLLNIVDVLRLGSQTVTSTHPEPECPHGNGDPSGCQWCWREGRT